MTKGEIITNTVRETRILSIDAQKRKIIKNSMESWARQQAIGFSQWLQDNGWHDSLIRGFKVKSSGKESIENLYDLYLKSF